ncbi:MAG: hypothetical protein V3V89_00375, partial [Gammaproteobacteria bacterium]
MAVTGVVTNVSGGNLNTSTRSSEDAQGLIGLDVGPGRLALSLSTALGFDDNLTLVDTNKESSFVTVISPHVAYVMSDKTRKFVLDYLIEAGFYEASSVDDYVDNRIRAVFDYHPTSRIFTGIQAEFLNSQDGRGRGRAEGGLGITQTSPDEWHHFGIGGKFAYGA